ncbi:ATP-binding cassette domain-containing protein [Geodermatophilus nigrescens]|uniref:ABC-2 type transport system ATP-binding protein n=1 Tax=Geodermatophilus nigrescens TaxID=1070870 RepID=A0A1M5JKU6_9ACTN|nr:ATP-binding cassette domain-containing protein [Geodermatophilus nigrescens]SHG40889.1 ABC-2 type transport system ATP-binding protein [Geodermatophilus nigrescens]
MGQVTAHLGDTVPAGGRAGGSGDVPAVEAMGLAKRFGSTTAVAGVDLLVPQGGVHGLLGPDGAGRTTTLRMLAAVVPPDGGWARVLGHDVAREPGAVRARVGLTGRFASLDEELTGAENLLLLARLLGYSRAAARRRTDQLLSAFGLTGAAGTRVGRYSGGMRRRADIAASIVVRPDVVLLDEPTAGLDPCSRNQVWDVVRALVRGGTTVLLSTGHLDEADLLADRVSVLDAGRVVAEGSPAQLKASVGPGTLHVRVRERERRAEARELLERVLGVPVEADADLTALTARVPGSAPATRALAALGDAGIDLAQFSLDRPGLDEVLLALTGRPAADEPPLGPWPAVR